MQVQLQEKLEGLRKHVQLLDEQISLLNLRIDTDELSTQQRRKMQKDLQSLYETYDPLLCELMMMEEAINTFEERSAVQQVQAPQKILQGEQKFASKMFFRQVERDTIKENWVGHLVKCDTDKTISGCFSTPQLCSFARGEAVCSTLQMGKCRRNFQGFLARGMVSC
ncbi:hypothetical protein GMAR_ORF103 [Golden Marseillevirus]|uniref:hypothetical protein n=1 Tax=Golden Marseillevirus TaxID=1720526 RepID=UPI000877ADE5|nr:hypothetical protein GMAR_ORF103 [Golden Marseillevirus]ALX27477.1 hypothetical protein GMAR_ORF103 [Golden Marseillevirus]